MGLVRQDTNEEPLGNPTSGNAERTLFAVKDSETEIWKDLTNGDVDALGQLYDLYIDKLYAHGMKQVYDKYYVMDCIHDLFIDLYKYRKKLARTDNVKYYLFKSLRRKINRKYQHKVEVVTLDSNQFLYGHHKNYTRSHEDQIILSELSSERSAKLSAALNLLSKKQKRGLFLRFNQGKSYPEIADIMGVSIETSRTVIYRAIKAIRKQNLSIGY